MKKFTITIDCEPDSGQQEILSKIVQINSKLESIMASQTEIKTQIAANTAKVISLTSKLNKIGVETAGTLAKVTDLQAKVEALQAIIDAGGNLEELSAAVSELTIATDAAVEQAQITDDLTPDVVTPPNGGGDVPSISGPATASGVVGEELTVTLSVAGSPASYGATGLPPGVSQDPVTGVISGTPTAAGEYEVALDVVNANGRGSAVLVITIA